MINLKAILEQHPNCIKNWAFLKFILKDRYPTEKRTINILIILLECGIVNKIKMKEKLESNEMQELMTQIENEYGILGQYSKEAILIWASVFDVNTSAVIGSISQDASNSVKQEPVVYVQATASDYRVSKRDDGYYISGFKGFEEEEMIIPSQIGRRKIKGIAHDAFKGCVTVKKIHISEGIEIIESGAFKSCEALEEVSLPNTLRKIGSELNEFGGAFAGTHLKSVLIPQNVEFLGPESFQFCHYLQKAEILGKIDRICKGTFEHCEKLSEVSLPDGLLTIEKEAFNCCFSLQEIHIPVGTQEIAKDTFWGARLKSVYIPPSVTKIGGSSTASSDETFGGSYGLTIYCEAGSAAMKYARKKNIKCAKAQF